MRPIDADALRQKIRQEMKTLSFSEPKEQVKRLTFQKALLFIKEQPTIEQPTWISCAERLPTEGVSIEMFFPVSQSICLGYYREIAKQSFWCVQFPDGTGRLGDEKPTHWRYRYITEKPQPPKGVE